MCLLQSTGKYFRYFNNNFRFQDASGDAVNFMSGVQADTGAACPPAFAGPGSTFDRAFNAYLPEDAPDAEKSLDLANTIVAAQTDLETNAATAIAEDGADALEAFGELCPDVDTTEWAKVFAAFEGGVIVAEKGSPDTFIGDAEDLVGELEDAVEEEDCASVTTDVKTTDVYMHLFPARRL